MMTAVLGTCMAHGSTVVKYLLHEGMNRDEKTFPGEKEKRTTNLEREVTGVEVK